MNTATGSVTTKRWWEQSGSISIVVIGLLASCAGLKRRIGKGRNTALEYLAALSMRFEIVQTEAMDLLRTEYSHAPHNDVSVKDGGPIRLLYYNIIIFPVVSLELFIDVILLAALWAWGRLSL